MSGLGVFIRPKLLSKEMNTNGAAAKTGKKREHRGGQRKGGQTLSRNSNADMQLLQRPLELELGCASSPPQRMPQPPERALRRCRATAVGGAEAA